MGGNSIFITANAVHEGGFILLHFHSLKVSPILLTREILMFTWIFSFLGNKSEEITLAILPVRVLQYQFF